METFQKAALARRARIYRMFFDAFEFAAWP